MMERQQSSSSTAISMRSAVTKFLAPETQPL